MCTNPILRGLTSSIERKKKKSLTSILGRHAQAQEAFHALTPATARLKQTANASFDFASRWLHRGDQNVPVIDQT